MKIEIKNRWSGSVQFTAEIECGADTPRGTQIRLALEWALVNKVSVEAGVFDGGDFARFDFARFYGARFDFARFDFARFDFARFYGARFYGASFDGARFYGARFDGAHFYGASFVGCIGWSGKKLVGPMPILTIGPIGSRVAPLFVESYGDGPWVHAGCWRGDLDGFRAAVGATHADGRHAKDYLALADFIGGWAARQREAADAAIAEAA